MSGAEQALESAILAVLAADAGVAASLGDPLRVLALASPQPGYPYLEIARHQSQPAESAGAMGSVHVIDLVVMSREEGGVIARAAMADVRAALRDAELAMADWRCTLLAPVFADVMRQAIGRWRALLRVRAVVEPL